MKQPLFLDPTTIANTDLAQRYACHPGPYAIELADLVRIFPGMEEQHYNPSEFPHPEYGDMNGTETEVLARILRWLEPKVLVEYGTLYGRSSGIMAMCSPDNARILTVDLPDEHRDNPAYQSRWSTDDPFLHGSLHPVGWHHQFLSPVQRAKITQQRMNATSIQFEKGLDTWLDGEHIDFALVDAAHDYYTTKQLFEQAFLRLRYGGVIMTDDYGNKAATHIGITEYFASIAREHDIKLYWYSPFPLPSDEVHKKAGYKAPSALVYVDIPKTRGLAMIYLSSVVNSRRLLQLSFLNNSKEKHL